MVDEHERVDWILSQFEQAVTALCGPRVERIDGTYRSRPSRYQEVRDDIAGQQGMHGSHARSLPPIWIDAVQWLQEVDRTVAKWAEWGESTPGRLTWLTEQNWRPDDIATLNNMTKACVDWASHCDDLIEPKRRWDLDDKCPLCNHGWVYRKDSAGEFVRMTALTITEKAAECRACNAKWGPELFQHLGRLLHCEPIAGVVEDGRMGA